MQRRLDLSDEQAEQVERIIRLRQVEIRKIRAEFQPKFEEQLDRISDEVAGVLTSGQATEWRQLLAEKRRLWLPPLPASASAPSPADP